MVEYNLLAFLDYYLVLLDEMDLVEHYVKGSITFLHFHVDRLYVVDYCPTKMKLVKI